LREAAETENDEIHNLYASPSIIRVTNRG